MDLNALSAKEWLEVYKRMVRIRAFEEKAVELFKKGELPGFIHSSVGQEAVAVSMTYYLRQEDFVTSTHRGHGHVLAKGADPGRMFAELYGKADGYCKGRGGSMHIIDMAQGVLGANGIVGAGIPIAVGAALSVRLDGEEKVTVCFFGDGAVNTGAFHEALNLAGLWRLPVVLVCENNQYAESTSFEDSIPIEDLVPRGASYGVPTFVIDGNDPAECLETSKEAVERARRGNGPTLIQANTYRWYGHHTGDTAPYRTDAEVEAWRKRDPVRRLEEALERSALIQGDTLRRVVAQVDEEIAQAIDFAKGSSDPDPADVKRYIYVDASRPKPTPKGEDVPRVRMREALRLAHEHAMEADRDVFVMGEDIADPMGGSYKITLGLSEKFGPERVRNTPISELGIVGAGVGAALVGKRPIIELMYIDFLTIAMDQLVNQAALIRYMSGGQASVPMVVRCQGGAWRSSAAQHSKSLEAWIAHVPGLKMVVPSTPTDAYWLLRQAIEDDNPVVFYEPNLLYGSGGELRLSTAPPDLEGAALRKAGSDFTLISWGYATTLAMEAAQELEERGISAEVIDLRHLAPLPLDQVLQSVAKTGLCCVVHEAWETGGIGAEIAATLAQEAFFYLDGPVKRVGAQHCPHPFSPILEQSMMPSKDCVMEEVEEWFSREAM